jgi:hypothetical protein
MAEKQNIEYKENWRVEILKMNLWFVYAKDSKIYCVHIWLLNCFPNEPSQFEPIGNNFQYVV